MEATLKDLPELNAGEHAAMSFDLSSNFIARRATSNSQRFDRREIATRGRRRSSDGGASRRR